LEDACRAAKSELATTQEVVTCYTQALADSLERNRVLEEEFGQLQGVAQSVVTEILGPRPELRALVTNLSEILGEVSGLFTGGVFHGTSGC
jgi:hypothetical protein